MVTVMEGKNQLRRETASIVRPGKLGHAACCATTNRARILIAAKGLIP